MHLLVRPINGVTDRPRSHVVPSFLASCSHYGSVSNSYLLGALVHLLLDNLELSVLSHGQGLHSRRAHCIHRQG